MSLKSTVLLAGAALVTAADIPVITFDGNPATTYTFKELNDPVMGGKSTGSWKVNTDGQYGVFDGEVVNVPSLAAPGFIKAAADGTYPDLSSALGGDLILNLRTSDPGYTGYRVTFASGTLSPDYACAGGGSLPLSRGCFKSKFMVPKGSNFTEVRVPFDSFSDMWSPATGEHTKECADDPDVCPTAKALSEISRFEIWGEGVAGLVHIELKSISVGGGKKVTPLAAVPAGNNTCKSAIQSKLKFGISGRTDTTGLPLPVTDETLAEAVCCDRRVQDLAEPQFLYQAPDILLYSKMTDDVTIFYDSACGVPVFQTPVDRTLDEFKADTDEHGWPSFRTPEVFTENVMTDKDTGYVTSVCGTHLGSYLPDEAGPRWCIDLSCISGNKM